MPWDEDLEQLRAQVIAVFGKEVYAAAERQVLAVVTAKARSAEDPLPMAVFRDALRMELRRLLQPH